MGYSIRIGSAVVTADTPGEAAELLREFGAAAPALRKLPPANDLLDDDAIEESLHAPIFPPWQSDPPMIGEGRYETPIAKSEQVGPARAGGDEGAGATPVAVSPAAATADQPDAPAPGEFKEKRPRSPRRGSVFKRDGGFLLIVVVDGKHSRRGLFKTREAAEHAQEETYQARLRGDPLPIYIWRSCRRCGEVGHTAMSCKAVNPTPPPPKARKNPPYIRPPGRAVHGSPEHRQKASEAGKAMWTKRRAAGTPAATDEWPRQETREATRAYWERYRIEKATPKPAPSCTENEEPVQGETLSKKEATPPRAESDEGADAMTVIRFRGGEGESHQAGLSAPAPDELLDDEGGGDLTDLVDVPDAEPTAIPEVDLNVECHACGQRGHRSNYEECPLNTAKGGPRPVIPRRPATLIPDSALRVRARSIPSRGHLTRVEKSELVEYPDDVERPLTREDCMSMPRPCPFVSCSHHLYLDVNPESGTLKLNFPHLEVWQMAETCSLDVADRGGITLEEIGAILNLTRERIRQVEVRGLTLMKKNAGYELGLPPDRNV